MTWNWYNDIKKKDTLSRTPKSDLTFREIIERVDNQGFHAIRDLEMQKDLRDSILEDIDLYGEAFMNMLKYSLAEIAKRD